jgi:ABC-type sugar transport system ATPase subunit
MLPSVTRMRSIDRDEATSKQCAIKPTVESGEFLTVVGPSVCGKSTLLKSSVVGVETVSFGHVQEVHGPS